MTFKFPKKKKKYKYNDVNQIRKWSIKKRNKHIKDINPEIFIEMALDGIEEWKWRIHPQIDLYKEIKTKNL